MKYSALALLFSVWPMAAQTSTLTCNQDGNYGGRKIRQCEIQEQKPGAFARISVDGRKNGGVAVKAWSGTDVLVRAKVEANGDTEGAARALYSQVIVHSSGGAIAADGPATGDWSVSYEVFVPAKTDLNLTAHNGGISITGVTGDLEFQTTNGGIHLAQVDGHVHGKTVNGGLHVTLAGARWSGSGMDVQSVNGGVRLEVPASYSAHLETSTVNGAFRSDIPLAVKTSNRQHSYSVDLGSGGAPLRVSTSNGGVQITKASL